jgi:hypothetical protein
MKVNADVPNKDYAAHALRCARGNAGSFWRIPCPHSFLVVPHRRTADPRCMKLCYSVCALSAQRSVFSLVREARLVVGPGDLEHP